MYEEFFSLSGSPFKLNPDPKFFFGSRSHNKAMAYLHYGLKQAEGFIVITGPIGSGKTMVISQLLDQLNETNIVAAQLLTSNIAPEELLDHMLSAFRIEPEGQGRTGKLEAFEDYLFDQLNRGRRVLLIMDEAQNLPFDTLEELRMLSNIDYDGTPLFQVFLVGQPEFRDHMQSQKLEQLRQRVIASYHLENLNGEETREYILHRLTVAGWRKDPVFDDDAIEEIFKETGGRPRRINTVANRVLLYCALEEDHEVSGEIARTVIAELHEENLQAMDVSDDEPVPPPHAEKMPAVRRVDEADTLTPDQVRERKVSGDDVVVPFDGARSRHAAPEAVSDGEEQAREEVASGDEAASAAESDAEEGSEAEPVDMQLGEEKMTETKPDELLIDSSDAPSGDATSNNVDVEEAETLAAPSAPAASALSGGSVFDRLRAKRNHGETDNRSEASLEDVAMAIASAREGALVDHPSDDDSAIAEIAALAPAAVIAPLKGVQAKEWRAQVKSSINDARDELKEAHSSVRRLRKSLTEMQRRRSAHREEIVSSIARAEALLNELHDSWR